MKLIFSKDGVKREITAPFGLCCSAEDLDTFIRELQRAQGGMLNSSYGWMRIDPSHPDYDSPPSTPPRRWVD